MRKLLALGVLLVAGCATQTQQPQLNQQGFDPQEAAKTRLSLGLTYLKNGNFKQAKFNLDKALQFAPEMADGHLSMGYYYQLVGEDIAARQSYQKAMQLAPNNPDIANSFGAYLCQAGDYQGAQTYFIKAIENPNYIRVAESYENLALCAQNAGKPADAINYLQNALKHEPGRSKSVTLLIQLLLEQQRWQEADDILSQYEKVGTVNANILWFRTQIEQGVGNAEKAQAYGNMLVQMYPQHPNAGAYLNSLKQAAAEPVERKPVPLTEILAKEQAQPDVETNDSEDAVAQELSQQNNVHIVSKNENLYRISLKYNVRLQSLIEWNNLPASGEVKQGQVIRLTPPEQ